MQYSSSEGQGFVSRDVVLEYCVLPVVHYERVRLPQGKSRPSLCTSTYCSILRRHWLLCSCSLVLAWRFLHPAAAAQGSDFFTSLYLLVVVAWL